MSAQHTYMVYPVPEGVEFRPEIDSTLPQNKVYWRVIGKVLEGELPKELYVPVDFVVEDDDALDWDIYDWGGPFPIVSQRTADLLAPYITPCFEFLPAKINGAPYFAMRCVGFIDCLNRAESVIEPFESNPQSIMLIKEYCFFKERIPDPALFRIPEQPTRFLFATEGIKAIVEANRLKGIQFYDTDTTVFEILGRRKKTT